MEFNFSNASKDGEPLLRACLHGSGLKVGEVTHLVGVTRKSI